jgi:hypothetical protein
MSGTQLLSNLFSGKKKYLCSELNYTNYHLATDGEKWGEQGGR